MKDLIEFSFSSVNVIPTALLLLILVYWLTVLIGALDLDFLNIDLDSGDVDMDVDTDIDVDAEIDAEADVDMNTSTSGAIMSMNSVLSFFNMGKVPFMLLLSFYSLSVWVTSILVNYSLGINAFLLSVALLIPNLILSLFVAKIVTTPFVYLNKRMTANSDDQFTYQGNICTIVMSASYVQTGQAEINDNGNTHRINIRTKEGDEIKKGQTALIIDYSELKKCYLVEPYNN